MKKLILILLLMPVIIFSQAQDTLKIKLSWCAEPGLNHILNWSTSDYLTPMSTLTWKNQIQIPAGVDKYTFKYVKPSHWWLGGYQVFFMVQAVQNGTPSPASNTFVFTVPFKADLAKVPGKTEVNINDQAFWVDFYNNSYSRVFNYLLTDSTSQSGLILGAE